MMKEEIKTALTASVRDFHLPRYREIPDVGLYLEQTVKYIDNYLAPLGDISLTGSMISNYVKKKLVTNPVKKQYSQEQIAYIIFIAVSKAAVSLDNLAMLIDMQKQTYAQDIAYDYFCDELENMIQYVFGLKAAPDSVGFDDTDEKVLLRQIIVTAAHKIYLDKCFSLCQSSSTP